MRQARLSRKCPGTTARFTKAWLAGQSRDRRGGAPPPSSQGGSFAEPFTSRKRLTSLVIQEAQRACNRGYSDSANNTGRTFHFTCPCSLSRLQPPLDIRLRKRGRRRVRRMCDLSVGHGDSPGVRSARPYLNSHRIVSVGESPEAMRRGTAGNTEGIVERPIGILVTDPATSETVLLHADCQFQHPMLAHGADIRIVNPPSQLDGVAAHCAVCRKPLKVEQIE